MELNYEKSSVNERIGLKTSRKVTKSSYGSVSGVPKFVVIPEGTNTKLTDSLLICEELDERWLKRRVWFNVLLINLAIFFLYVGVVPVTIIQSSINEEQGLGVASLAVKNGFMVLGSIFGPLLLYRFQCKTVLVVGTVLYATYVPANFYSSWWTLIPFAALAGFGCAMEGVARKVYLARLAHIYADITKSDVDRVNSRIFVLMICAIKLSTTLGDLAASVILDAGLDNDARFEPSRLDTCGINYCNQMLMVTPVNQTKFEKELQEKEMIRMYLLIAFCTVSCALAVICFMCLDKLQRLGIVSGTDRPRTSPVSALKELFIEMKDYKHILFIPMALALSGGDSFWTADYNKAFITCSIGMAYLGYVSIWNGISATVSCVLLGWYNNTRVRSLPVVSATILQLAVVIGLFYWTPSYTVMRANYWTLSIFAIIFFFGHGIRHFITPALVSVVFKDNLETAFSVYHFWLYVSSTVFLAWSNFLCIDFKVYFLMVVIALSFFGYVGIEILVHLRDADKMDDDDGSREED